MVIESESSESEYSNDTIDTPRTHASRTCGYSLDLFTHIYVCMYTSKN